MNCVCKRLQVTVAAGIFIATTGVLRSEPVTLRFAPKVGSRFTETIRRETLEERSGPSPVRQTKRSSIVNDWEIRQQDGNYLYVCTTRSFLEEGDGKQLLNQIRYEGLEQTHVVSSNGQLLRTTLNRDLVVELKQQLRTNLNSVLAQTFTTEAFAARERKSRQELIVPLVGRTVKEGDKWTSEPGDKNPELLHGSEHYALYTVPAIARHGGGDTTVKFLYFMCTDKHHLEDFPLEEAKDIYSRIVTDFLDSIVSGKVLEKLCIKRLINAETMTLISEDKIQRTIFQTKVGLWIVTERTQCRYDEKN
jgi:hypothetical protein